MNKYESAKEELYNALWILCEEQDDVMSKSVWAIIQNQSWKKYISWQLSYLIWHSESWEESFWRKQFTAVSQRIQWLIAHYIMAA